MRSGGFNLKRGTLFKTNYRLKLTSVVIRGYTRKRKGKIDNFPIREFCHCEIVVFHIINETETLLFFRFRRKLVI